MDGPRQPERRLTSAQHGPGAERVPPSPSAGGGESRDRRRRRGPGTPRSHEGWRGIAFALGLGIPVLLALRGGSYDLIARQQFALVLWWGIGLGFLLGVLPAARPARETRLPFAALAGLVVWTMLSLAWTESAERTVDELARTLNYAGLVVLAWSTLSRDNWRSAASGLCVAVAGVTVLGVISRLLPGAFPPVQTALLDGERLRYPLEYWNAVAGWGAMALAVGLAWSAATRQLWQRSLSLALVPVAGVSIYLTYSRGGLLVGAVSVIVVVALSRERWTAATHASAGLLGAATVVLAIRSQPAIAEGTGGDGALLVAAVLLLACIGCGAFARWTRGIGGGHGRVGFRIALAAAAGAVALAAGALLVAADPGAESSNRAYPGTGTDPAARFLTTESPRSEVWQSALEAWESGPLAGIGPGTFEFWWARGGPRDELVRDAHSLYLEFLAELGVPGLLLLAAFLVGLTRVAVTACKGMRRGRDGAVAVACVAILAVFLVQAGFDWMWELTAVGATALSAGAIAGAAISGPRRRSRRMTVWRLGMILLATLAGAIQLPGLIATDRVRESAHVAALGLGKPARESASEAISASPWAASPYAARAFGELLSGDLTAARNDAHEAIEREPTNWRHRLLLAEIEAKIGNDGAESRARRQLRRLRPGFEPETASAGPARPSRDAESRD